MLGIACKTNVTKLYMLVSTVNECWWDGKLGVGPSCLGNPGEGSCPTFCGTVPRKQAQLLRLVAFRETIFNGLEYGESKTY